MIKDVRYKGIVFMLMAALCFSMMGGAAKALKEVFSAGQLVLYRNASRRSLPPCCTGGFISKPGIRNIIPIAFR